jgi:hypothetical protein
MQQVTDAGHAAANPYAGLCLAVTGRAQGDQVLQLVGCLNRLVKLRKGWIW